MIPQRRWEPRLSDQDDYRGSSARAKKSAPLFSSELAILKQRLQESPNTVTSVLETLTGERVVAEVMHQNPLIADAVNELEVSPGEVLIHRLAVLKGRNTGRALLCAESMFVPERIPSPARSQLANATEPIGRVLVAHGMTLDREPLTEPVPLDSNAAGLVADLAAVVVWSRAYRLMMHGKPVFAIREWFLEALIEALSRQIRS